MIMGLMQYYTTSGMLLKGELDFKTDYAKSESKYMPREAVRRCNIVIESLQLKGASCYG